MTPLQLAQQKLEDSDVTPEMLVTEAFRVSMQQHIEQDKIIPLGHVAEIATALAALRKAGGTESLRDALESFMQGPE